MEYIKQYTLSRVVYCITIDFEMTFANTKTDFINQNSTLSLRKFNLIPKYIEFNEKLIS